MPFPRIFSFQVVFLLFRILRNRTSYFPFHTPVGSDRAQEGKAGLYDVSRACERLEKASESQGRCALPTQG